MLSQTSYAPTRVKEWEDEPFGRAIHSSDVARLRELDLTSRTVNSVSRRGMTPLLVAITNGSAEIVSLLVEAGADIGWGPHAQCTPLVAAVHAGNCDIVSTLLKAGADVNGMTGLHQVTPLIVAATRQNTDMVDLLLRKGADPNLCDATGVCPLFASIQHAASIRHDLSIRGEAHTRNESVSHMLIEAGASLSCSPMHKLAMDMLPTMCSSTLVDAIKAAEARIIAEGTDVVRKPTYYSHF